MSKYNWDLNDLINRKNEIKKQLAIYEDLLTTYSDLIEAYDKRIIINNMLSSDRMQLQFQKKGFLEKLELVISSIEILKDYQLPFINCHFSNLILNDDELIEMTRDLFKQLPCKDFLEKFNYFTNPDNHLFHIRHYKKIPTDALGLTFQDPVKQECFGLISRYNTVEDIISLGHEIFHMIIRESEKPLFWKTPKTVYTEVEGYFANLIFSRMLSKTHKSMQQDLTQMDIRDLQTMIDSVNYSFIVKNSLSLVDKSGKIDFQKLNGLLQQYNINDPINAEVLSNYIEGDFEEELNTSSSYLVALDLYHEWQNDPEKAFYHLIQIPNLEGENPKCDLEQIGVTFFEDGYKSLENHCKTLLKQPKRKH